MNLPQKDRLDVVLSGKSREYYNAHLLTVAQWRERVEYMPAPCRDVVTGEATYSGLEGIGHSPENGWYLVLYEPPDPELSEFASIGEAGLKVYTDVPDYHPTAGTLLLLFFERGEVQGGE